MLLAFPFSRSLVLSSSSKLRTISIIPANLFFLFIRGSLISNWISSISEHSLFAEQLKMPKNVTNGPIEIHGVSAHDNPPILSGQIAHGGVALVWRNRLNDFIKPVKGIDHDRIVAIQCNFSLDYTLFIIAVYLPSTNHSIDEFNESIDFLWAIYDSLSEKGYVYVLGDFNADLGNSAGSKGWREPNSRGKKLSKFVDQINLTAVNLSGNSSGPLKTYISHCGRFRSTIDYIIIPNCVLNSVLYSRTFESCVENTSDHYLPVLAKISLDGLSLFKNSVEEITRRPKLQNKLISSERPFKILQNETKIIKIDQAVLKIFNFKD